MSDDEVMAAIQNLGDRDAANYLNTLGDRATCDSCNQLPANLMVALQSSGGVWNELLCRQCADDERRIAHRIAFRSDLEPVWH